MSEESPGDGKPLQSAVSPYKDNRIDQSCNSSVLTTPSKTPGKVVVTESEQASPKMTLEELGCKQWKEAVEYQNSVFTDTLMGQLLSTITCRACSHASHTFESFFVLELPLPRKERVTLRQCLEDYCIQEELSDGWKCPNCKVRRPASKSLHIWRLPPIIAICFKRFGDHTAKNECLVSVSLAGVDLKAALSPLRGGRSVSKNIQTSYVPFSFVVIDDLHSTILVL